MGYCAQSDLSERFGDQELKQLTDETSGAAISASEVTAACDEAASEIDSYLGKRYTIPIASPPSILKKWACDLARLYLWGDKAGIDSAVRKEAENARSALRDIAKGVAVLPGYQAAPGASPIGAAMTERTSNFTDDVFKNQMLSFPTLFP